MVKNLPANVGETGREDPRKKETTHSSILAWRILWTEEPGGLQTMGFQKSPTQLNDSNNKQQSHLTVTEAVVSRGKNGNVHNNGRAQ